MKTINLITKYDFHFTALALVLAPQGGQRGEKTSTAPTARRAAKTGRLSEQRTRRPRPPTQPTQLFCQGEEGGSKMMASGLGALDGCGLGHRQRDMSGTPTTDSLESFCSAYSWETLG